MDLAEYLIRTAVSLAIVLALLFILLPLFLRRFMGVRGSSGKGSFEIRKVSPVSKNLFIVELDIKGKTYVLVVGERGADVIYREDDKDNPSPAGPRGNDPRPGEGDTSRRA